MYQILRYQNTKKRGKTLVIYLDYTHLASIKNDTHLMVSYLFFYANLSIYYEHNSC